MALLDDLYSASFKGVPFLTIKTHNTTGGRKTVTHEYPNSDRRFVEDLGLQNKTFSVTGIIHGDNYTAKRNALIRVLEDPGLGILIHPFFGTLQVTAKPYTVVEDMTRLNVATFTLVFEQSQEAILPKQIFGQLSSVISNVSEALIVIQTLVKDIFKVATASNFVDAVSKLENLTNTFETVTKKFGGDDNFNSTFSDNLASFSSSIPTLISEPENLGVAMVGLFTSLDDALRSPEDAKATFSNFYDLGDDDTEISVTTGELQERAKNRDVLNASIQTTALLLSYQNVPQFDFLTVDDINKERDLLEEQYQKIITNTTIKNSDRRALENSRDEVRKFFDNQALKAFRLSEFKTKTIPISVLSYTHYANLDNVDTLISLNKITNPSFISGDVTLLTA